MRLVEIELELPKIAIPAAIRRLLAMAKDYQSRFDSQIGPTVPAFVASDYELVYRALAEIDARRLAAGRVFVEWGSGLGVVTCLAEQTGFDAVGIEIEPRLTALAQEIAHNEHIAVEFVCGSFVPPEAERRLDYAGDVTWISTSGPDGYAALDLEPDDFDIVYAYPWPGEEQVIFDLFTDCAASGALLLTYHGQDGVRLQRKLMR